MATENGNGSVWKVLFGALVTILVLVMGYALRTLDDRIDRLDGRVTQIAERQFEGQGRLSRLESRVDLLEARKRGGE